MGGQPLLSPKGPSSDCRGSCTKIIPALCVQPHFWPSRLTDNHSQKCLYLVTPILSCHCCSSLSSAQNPLVLSLTHGELPQVSVVEMVTQLFPSTENMMIVPFPLMFYKKQATVKSTKLGRNPDHAHDSWRASNVLCHRRQMDRSMTYTYNPLQQSR